MLPVAGCGEYVVLSAAEGAGVPPDGPMRVLISGQTASEHWRRLYPFVNVRSNTAKKSLCFSQQQIISVSKVRPYQGLKFMLRAVTYQPQVVISSVICSVRPCRTQRTKISSSREITGCCPGGWVHVGRLSQVANHCNICVKL